jgi:hypothetical protein
MPNAETIRLQNMGVREFTRTFPSTIIGKDIEIRKEWLPFNRWHDQSISSPMIDIAIGPFAIETRCIREYDALLTNRNVRELLQLALEAHTENLERCNNREENLPEFDDFFNGEFTNTNARCFMAIEVEGREDRKVVLADIINTSAMGRFGIIVAKSERVLKIFVKLLNYLLFLQSVEKPTFRTKNVLILSSEQFSRLLTSLPCPRPLISKSKSLPRLKRN